MYTRLTRSKNSKNPTLQIVKGVREGKKVKQKIIASLGSVKNKEDLLSLKKLAENLIRKLEKEGLRSDPKIYAKKLKHKKTIYNGFGLVIDKLMELSGFSEVIRNIQGRQKFDLEKIIKLILIQRLNYPSSKLRTYERQEDHGFFDVKLEHIYRAMDLIGNYYSEIQKKAFKTICSYSNNPIDCFFFDVTTLYFESVIQDDLRDFGFSKDQKFNYVQIVLALVVDSEGNPIAYETFKGNLSETKTLLPVLQSLKDKFSIKNVTIVCDRGLASKANVQSLKETGFNFVIATKLKSISKNFKLNDISKYKPLPGQEGLTEEEKILYLSIKHPQYEDALLISTYSPLRAKRDMEERERFLEKLQKKINFSDKTSVKKLINNGNKKYISIKKGSYFSLNQNAIEDAAAWDGFHGIAVSNGANLSIEKALDKYKDLWHVEETFRIAKTTLKTRPIFHWVSHRIKSHVLLCFMTLFVERFLEFLLRKSNVPLTPDRIRRALLQVNTVIFEDEESKKIGKMESALSDDARKIFETLGIPLNRVSDIN